MIFSARLPRCSPFPPGQRRRAISGLYGAEHIRPVPWHGSCLTKACCRPPGVPGLVPVLQSKSRRNGGDSPVAAVHFIFSLVSRPGSRTRAVSSRWDAVSFRARSCHWARARRRPGQPFLRGILLFSGPRLPGLCLCQIAAQQVALGEGPAHGHAHNVFGVVVGKEAAAAVKSPIPIWIFYSLLTW